jgi:hypothetical protein
MKKGYKAEYEVKKKLERKYSAKNIFKLAIGGKTDFFILEPKKRRILKLIEVKTTKKDSWYPGEHDFKQFKILNKISKEHKIPVEYWIKINGKWKIFNLNEVKKFFS